MEFKKAVRTQRKLRMSLIGASGTGKSYTALVIAKELGKSIAVIDTEHSSASLYADTVAQFDTCELTHYAPRDYIKALTLAKAYDVVIIDSLSHAWMGEGGLLDQADKKGGRFDAWKDLTPQQNEMFETMLSFPGHIIVTMRSKTEYLVTKYEKDGKEKTKVERVGLAPIQRKESEYEFDVVCHMDQDNVMHVIKSRFDGLDEDVRKPDAKWALRLRAALETGAPAKEAPLAKQDALAETLERIRKAAEAYDAVASQADLDALNQRISKSPDFIKTSNDVVTAMQKAQERLTAAAS